MCHSLLTRRSAAFPTCPPPSPHPALPNHAISILVYGAGSTTAQYTLHAAGHTNVLATASLKHHVFLRTLGDGKVALALNAITMEGTLARIAEVLSVQGTLTLLLPIKAERRRCTGRSSRSVIHSQPP
ncbi:hypothetical protein B0H14DRAFT_3868996 [Mycena olivaceomarginata]|nr:hypothetical protein B0H14DRAFT_3868996 [Mycena olivaceomarginata]